MTSEVDRSKLSPEELARLLTDNPKTDDILSFRGGGYLYIRPSGGPTLVKPGSETKPIETWPHRPNSGS